MPYFRYTIDPGPDFESLRSRYAPGEVAVRMAEGIRAGLDRANLLALSKIQRERFNGVGPFPVSQRKLGHRTRRLVRSLGASRAVVRNAASLTVGSGIGTNVKYFGPHEFGYDGPVKVPAHRREMPEITRTSRTGRRYTVPAHTQSVRAHSRRLKVPERRPLRTGLAQADVKEIYKAEIYTGIVDALTDPKIT